MPETLTFAITPEMGIAGRLRALDLVAAINAGLDDAAQRIVPIMQDHMNFDKGYSTGATEASVDTRDEGPLARSIGPTTDYALFLEYGTGRLGIPPLPHRADWPGMSPEMFAHPSMPEAVIALSEAMVAALTAALMAL